MHMLNPHCGIDRDSRGVVRLTICDAGPLNILGTGIINRVREGIDVGIGNVANGRAPHRLVFRRPHFGGEV